MEEGDILRQRRNLVAMSCMLIIFDLAEVEVAKVGVLGTDLIIGDVRVLAISMWIVWAYLLLRYYQYWRLEKPHVSNAVYEQVDANAIGYASRSLMRARRNEKVEIIRRGWLRDWEIKVTAYSPSEGGTVVRAAGRMPWWRVLSWKFRAWRRVVIHTPYFTEHALPLVLAAATPAVAVLTKIFGKS